jgi:hypothetical protein
MPLTCIPGSVLCGLGLPEILLWVLVFTIVYGILNMLKIFGTPSADGKTKHPAHKIHAIIALVVAFFVLISVPTSVIGIITSMANSFVVIAISLIVVVALLQITVCENYLCKPRYAGYIALALVVVMALVFVGAGGLAFIGISSLPAVGISLETIVLVLIAIAILWLILS